MLREARKNDAEKLALIHSVEFGSDFLPSLGREFLVHLYRDFIANRRVEVIIFDFRREICGFIVGAEDFNRIFKEIIFKNFCSYFYIIVRRSLTKPFLIKNVFDTLLYLNKEGIDLRSELVVIAVSSKFHRKGIGRELINEMERKFKKKKINEYKVNVNKKNTRANMFYKALGFIKAKEFFLYGKKIDLLTKKI